MCVFLRSTKVYFNYRESSCKISNENIIHLYNSTMSITYDVCKLSVAWFIVQNMTPYCDMYTLCGALAAELISRRGIM